MKLLWLTILLLLVPVGVIRGDVGPPGFVRDERFPAIRFDNLADYPQFDFYLLYTLGPGNPYGSPHRTRVHSGETVRRFEGKGRKGNAMLLAVSHGQQPPPLVSGSDWFESAPPGCLRSASLEGTYLGEEYLVSYRVRIDKDKLEATMQTTEAQPVEMTVSWLKRLPCIAVPLAFCLALAWLGARMARRLFPAKSDGAMSQGPRMNNVDNAG